MILPLKSKFNISQEFGNKLMITDPNSPLYIDGKEDYYARYGLNGHDGLDIVPVDENGNALHHVEVVSPIKGTVIEAQFLPDYGNYVKIENDSEGSTLAHLLDFTVSVGEVIEEGTLLGHSDNTGKSTAEHLHWGYFPIPRDLGNGYDGYIDQRPILEKLGLLVPLSGSTPVTDLSPTAPGVEEGSASTSVSSIPASDAVNSVLMYNGLDLHNEESMKVCVDVWNKLNQGLLVDKTLLDQTEEKYDKALAQIDQQEKALMLLESRPSDEDKIALMQQTSNELTNQLNDLQAENITLKNKLEIVTTDYQHFKDTHTSIAVQVPDDCYTKEEYEAMGKELLDTNTKFVGILKELQAALAQVKTLSNLVAKLNSDKLISVSYGVEAAQQVKKLEQELLMKNPLKFLGDLIGVISRIPAILVKRDPNAPIPTPGRSLFEVLGFTKKQS